MKILDWTNSVTKALQTLLTQAPPLKCENVGLTLSLPCEVLTSMISVYLNRLQEYWEQQEGKMNDQNR